MRTLIAILAVGGLSLTFADDAAAGSKRYKSKSYHSSHAQKSSRNFHGNERYYSTVLNHYTGKGASKAERFLAYNRLSGI